MVVTTYDNGVLVETKTCALDSTKVLMAVLGADEIRVTKPDGTTPLVTRTGISYTTGTVLALST
jgi:hypothetical protein